MQQNAFLSAPLRNNTFKFLHASNGKQQVYKHNTNVK